MIRLLIEITLIMLVLLGIYHLLLTNTTLHKFKRAYLLLCLILPLCLPFIEWEISKQEQFKIPSDEIVINNLIQTFDRPQTKEVERMVLPQAPARSFIPKSALQTEQPTSSHLSKIDYKVWVISLYALITFMLLLRYGLSVFNILRKTKNARREQFHGKTVIILEEITPPHNFLNFIFINEKDYENETIRDGLLLHELSHAQERHSLDILIVELLRIIFWFNPLYILLSRAIRNNHEYLADTAVIQEFKDISSYQKLLLGFAGQQFTGPTLASLSNYNLIKKRFIMMKHKTPRSVIFLRVALLVPLLLGSTAFFVVKPQDPKLIITVATPLLLLQDEDLTTPDILPIDPDQYDYGNFSGRIEVPDGEVLSSQMMDSQWGIDYVALPGTPVRSTASGTVTEVKENDKRFGNFIKVRHNDSTETLYAKLNKLNVKVGQSLNKGENIGFLGSSDDIFGRVHYKILVNGKPFSFWSYSHLYSDSRNEQTFHLHALGVGSKNPFKDQLEKTSFNKKLPDNLALENMVFDRKKVIIIKHSGETITKMASELNEAQKRAILSITQRPYRFITRKTIPDHVVDKWDNYNYYKIWIDGERVDNNEMSKHTASDFAHHGYVAINKKSRNPSAFELWLQTPEYHAKEKAKFRARELAWRKETRKLLKESGLI